MIKKPTINKITGYANSEVQEATNALFMIINEKMN